MKFRYSRHKSSYVRLVYGKKALNHHEANPRIYITPRIITRKRKKLCVEETNLPNKTTNQEWALHLSFSQSN